MRIYEPSGRPPVGFEAVPATLEDAYLLLMQDAEQATGDEPEPLAVAAAGAAGAGL